MRYSIVGLVLLVSALTYGMDTTSKKPFEPSIAVRCHGKLRTGIVSIGGETTGTTITFSKRVWELKLLDEEATRFSENHNKEPVTVVGKLHKVQGTETKTRWIVDVKTLEERDAKVTAEGVALTIQGTLRTTKSTPHQPARLSIEAGDISWPIVFPMDPKLLSKAETLVGKPVSIQGALEPDQEGDPVTTIPIQIKTLVAID